MLHKHRIQTGKKHSTIGWHNIIKHRLLCVFDMWLCPYLTMRWVAMVTKGQRVVILKERRADFWIHGQYLVTLVKMTKYYFYYSGLLYSLSLYSSFVVYLYLTLQFCGVTDSQSNELHQWQTPTISSGVFHPADLLSACKDVITGASEIMREGDERRAERTSVTTALKS